MALFSRYSSMHEGFRTRVICITHATPRSSSHGSLPRFVRTARDNDLFPFVRLRGIQYHGKGVDDLFLLQIPTCRGMTGVKSSERCITGRRIVSAMLGRMFEIRLTPDFAPAIASAG